MNKYLFASVLLFSCKEVVHEAPCGGSCPCFDSPLCEPDCVSFPQFFSECHDCTLHPESFFCDCQFDPAQPGCDPCALHPEDPCCDSQDPSCCHGLDCSLPCSDVEFCGTTGSPDGFDNDCDGIADNGCACVSGEQLSCYTGPSVTRGVGECRDGVALCDGVALDGSETWGSCVGEQRPLPNDDCGADGIPPKDTNCNGILGDGCSNLFVTCSPEIFAAPLQTLTVSAIATPSAGVITSTSWQLTARPIGSSAQPNNTDSLDASLPLDLAGDYVMTFTAQDSAGQSNSCSTIVRAVSSEGLRIELSWNTDSADINAHLLHPTATRWNDSLLDCNVGSCTGGLSWSGAETVDDPVLALHDEDGFGPENINIEAPELNGAYRFGAYNFSDFGDGPSDVLVRIFCGGAVRAQFAHADLIGSSVNEPPNQLWKVADISFSSSAECAVVPLDQIITMGASGSPR